MRREQDLSKQVTCKGGLALEREIRVGHVNPELLTPSHIMACKSSYTMTSGAPYTNASLRSVQARDEVVRAVKDFHTHFIAILDKDRCEEFGISLKTMQLFAEIANRDLDAYMTSAVNALISRDASADEHVEDIPFFYPIIPVIRHTLIPALSADNI